MALIKAAQYGSLPPDAVVLDLGDLMRQGEAITAQAKARAELIVAQAKAERERLFEGAAEEGRKIGLEEGKKAGYEEGFEAGRREALEARQADLARIESSWTAALEELARIRGGMLTEARDAVVRLAAAVAAKVTRRAVELDRSVVERQLEAALSALAGPTRFRVVINPDDRAIVDAALPGLMARFPFAMHAEIAEDAGVDRGGCRLMTGVGGEIDATISTQIDRMIGLLLPDHECPPAQGSGGDLRGEAA